MRTALWELAGGKRTFPLMFADKGDGALSYVGTMDEMQVCLCRLQASDITTAAYLTDDVSPVCMQELLDCGGFDAIFGKFVQP